MSTAAAMTGTTSGGSLASASKRSALASSELLDPWVLVLPLNAALKERRSSFVILLNGARRLRGRAWFSCCRSQYPYIQNGVNSDVHTSAMYAETSKMKLLGAARSGIMMPNTIQT